jgi:tetratricopeptide (TPR) repeat protein
VSLLMRAVDVRGHTSWRWLLADEAGSTLAYHEVALDEGDAAYPAFRDLAGHVRWNADPDRRASSEAEIISQLGQWAGRHVLGERIARALVAASPVTVRVRVPADAAFLCSYPLELAHAAGVPLVRHGVTIVWEAGGEEAAHPKQPVGDRLRVLALFSLPTGHTMLALRRERYELERLACRVVARAGLAVQLEVLQYGVTREHLKAAAEDGEGWDIVHISGHGLAGGLMLEAPDGSADLVSADDLIGLLRPARHRLKLAVLSTCSSGAVMAGEALRSIGLLAQAEVMDRGARLDVKPSTVGLAQQLVHELDVAVLGMRYQVSDEFAIALANQLYLRLFQRQQPVDVAVGQAVAEAAGEAATAALPALSIGTPALFGPAAGLKVVPPRGRVTLDPRDQKLAALPVDLQELPRFVGRTPAMTAANAALASSSGFAGVVFHGMAGSGKTWCAAELAQQNQNRFEALAWWSAPSRAEDVGRALVSLANILEAQLGQFGFTMAYAVGDQAEFERFLPGLTAMLRNHGLLLVMDNMEALQSADGTWLDPRWELLFEAMTRHGGESRIVLTTRAKPPALKGGQRVLVESVHALTLAESVLLARELPNLRALLHLDPGPADADQAIIAADRHLACRTLLTVQGHPRLLTLANAGAADPAVLAARLDAAESAAQSRGAMLTTFFADGISELDASQFLAVLAGWTSNALADAPEPSRLLASLLACAEDEDRTSAIMGLVWPGFWNVARGTPHPMRPPDLTGALRPLEAAALVDVEPPGRNGEPERYRLHPAVADAIRDATPESSREVADEFLAGTWTQISKNLRRAEVEGRPASSDAVDAAFASAPYLVRMHEWRMLGFQMDAAIRRDHSPRSVRRVIAYLQLIPDDGSADFLKTWGTRAQALQVLDRSLACEELRRLHREALRRGEPGIAQIAGDLLAALSPEPAAGETREDALAASDDDSFLRQLAGETDRLDSLADAGEHQQVLDRAAALLTRMDRLPARVGWAQNQPQWEFRELMLIHERDAAIALGDWDRAQTAHERLGTSMLGRNASPHMLASRALDGVEILIQHDEFDQAEDILRRCQETLEERDDQHGICRALTARARVASRRGQPGEAVRNQQAALRLAYAQRDLAAVAVSHAALGDYLTRQPGNLEAALAHHLAAALVTMAVRDASPGPTLRDCGLLMRDNARPVPPRSFSELAGIVERSPGIRFREAMGDLVPDPADQQAALDQLTATARGLTDEELVPPGLLAYWAEGIDMIVAAAGGDPEARSVVDDHLTRFARTTHRTELIDALRQIAAGQADPSLLTARDPFDSAILQAVLSRLHP